MPVFVPSLDLNAAFYDQVVSELVGPWNHSAALLGWGSDILGFDTERSTDHGWGPRLLIFAAEADVTPMQEAVDAGLPESFRGWPTRYGWDEVPVRHWVEVHTLGSWLEQHLGLDPRPGMRPVDWLVVPQQRLLGVVRGAVYHDDLGELAALRAQLRWYPDEVWLWLVACQWRRIAQEEAFVGRAAEVGDDLGTRLLAGRMVRQVMGLAFLLARVYWPYPKWFGTAFGRLPDPDGLGPALSGAVAAETAADRKRALVAAYEIVARRHNATGITPPVDPTARPYFGRPFRVIVADRFVAACRASITDPRLSELPLLGSVDQCIDSTDLLRDPKTVVRLRALYGSAREG